MPLSAAAAVTLQALQLEELDIFKEKVFQHNNLLLHILLHKQYGALQYFLWLATK